MSRMTRMQLDQIQEQKSNTMIVVSVMKNRIQRDIIQNQQIDL